METDESIIILGGRYELTSSIVQEICPCNPNKVVNW